ncbi:MAG: type II secretion system F family protein [Sedimentisphaerales bacterium]|nr:type II secretion system F family protein [Sedimentisphaerales bacterium]
MPTFEYIALDTKGAKNRGSITAESAAAARRLLRNRRLHATQLRPVKEASHTGRWEWGRLLSTRRRRTILEFTRQLSTMIKADVKLTEGLSVLISQTGDPKFAQILQNIRDQVMAGESLAEGLKEYPGWFDPIYVSMIRVGEATGNLGRSLTLLADYISKKLRLESKIKSALVYPAILIIVCVLVVTFLLTFVVPNVTKIITSSGRELPAVTRLLINVSHFFTGYWWIILIVLGLGWWLFKRILATRKGRMAFDRFILKIPVTGELMRQGIVARFTSTLAALIRSGLPMADSLQTVAEVTGNAVMAHAVRQARERIIAGADVATPLRESKVVGPAVAHMITVGEKTGELESMLITVAESIEESTDISVQRLSSVIEPIIIIIMAIIVGFIVLAIMLPIFQATDISNL